MHDILLTATSFPAVVFTVFLGLVLLYWLSVVAGALDVDVFGADAAGEALDGVFEGAVESAVDGAAEGAAEAAEAGGDSADSGDSSPGVVAALIAALGLRRVPVTVSFSLVVLGGWIAAMIGSFYLTPLAAGWAIRPLVLILALIAGLLVAALLVRPLAPLFATHTGKHAADYVGSTCVVTTGRVDAGFGQARIETGGDVLCVAVRCDRPAATLCRGAEALIVDYDAERRAYVIEPMQGLLGDSNDS